jgi:hypothetical protein
VDRDGELEMDGGGAGVGVGRVTGKNEV